MFKYRIIDQTLSDCLPTCRAYEGGVEYPEVDFLKKTSMVIRKVYKGFERTLCVSKSLTF